LSIKDFLLATMTQENLIFIQHKDFVSIVIKKNKGLK